MGGLIKKAMAHGSVRLIAKTSSRNRDLFRGLQAAKARGRVGGRKLGVSRQTICRQIDMHTIPSDDLTKDSPVVLENDANS